MLGSNLCDLEEIFARFKREQFFDESQTVSLAVCVDIYNTVVTRRCNSSCRLCSVFGSNSLVVGTLTGWPCFSR